MREWIIGAGALLLFGYGIARLRRYAMRKHIESDVLQKKYGDLPMFEEFFRRLEEERQKDKGRVS